MSEKSSLSVADVMSTEFLLMPGMATVAEALEKMVATNASAVLIDKRTDRDEYGIVLTSDIAKQVLAIDRSPERVNLYEIMSKPVISVEPKMRIRYCARLFEQFGIPTAPVVENGVIRGIVTYDWLVLKGLAAGG